MPFGTTNAPVLAYHQAEGHQPLQTITELLEDPYTEGTCLLPATDLAEEQQKDASLVSLIQYLTDGTLPQDPDESKLLLAKAPSFALLDMLLYHIDVSNDRLSKWSSLCISARRSCTITTEEGCPDTSQATGCSVPLPGHGGGSECSQTSQNFAAVALSVALPLGQEGL